MTRLFTEDNIGFVDLVDRSQEDAALKVVNSARISYKGKSSSFTDKDRKLASYLWEHQHTCYDDKTEVFTSEGWVLWHNITSKHLLATVSSDGKTFRFEKPNSLISKDYTGKMLSIEQAHVSLLVTPEHKLFVSKRKSYGFKPYSLISAKDSYHKQYRMKSYCNYEFLDNNLNEADFLVGKLIGFFLGDGHRSSKNTISFHLSKIRKIDYIKDVLIKLNLNFRINKDLYHKNKNTVNIRVTIPESISDFLTGDSRSKVINRELLENFSSSSGILDGLINSGGSKKRNTFTYSTVNRNLKDSIVDLGTRLGFNIRENKPQNGLFKLMFISRSLTPRVNDSGKHDKWVDYNGKVFCATVSTGLLLVRRNGKQIISGNSPWRHSWYTFHIKFPLFVARQWLKYQVASYWKTFELNGDETTIRIDEIENIFDTEKGCNWNEISGRYVQLIPEFYYPKFPRANPSHGNKQASVPIEIEGDQWLQTMKQACEDSYKSYQSLLEQGIAKEIARMVLPQNIYCVSIDTPILTEDLRWVDAGSLCDGDRLLGFEEFSSRGRGSGRKILPSIVQNFSIKEDELYRINLDNGESLVCNKEHKWLANYKCGKSRKWVSTEKLIQNPSLWIIPKIFNVWEDKNDYKAGYLAASFDGEGCVTKTPYSGLILTFAQKNNSMLAKVRNYLDDFSVKYTVSPYYENKVQTINILGGFPMVLEFLGKFRPVRLLDVWKKSIRGHLTSQFNYANISSIEYIGKGKIASFSTSTKTYFANGYPCHNSEAYWTVSLQSVIHFLKQRHLSCNPDSQYEIQIYADCIYKLVKDDLDKLGIELK